MSVITETRLVEYAGNGVTTSFPVPFRFLENAHVVATLIDDTTLVETVLALGTNYTLAGVGTSTGTLTAIVAPGLGKTLRIERVVPITQTSLFSTQGPFSPAAYEKALDHQAMAVQQVREQTTQEAAAAALSAGSAASSAAASAASSASASASAAAAAAAVSAAAVPGSATLLTATGSTTPRTLADRYAQEFDIEDFGGVGDWNGTAGTDNTASLNAALAYLVTQGGGTLRFRKRYKVSGHVIIPNDGVPVGGVGGYGRQVPIRLVGLGGDVRNGQGQIPGATYAGSELALVYNGSGVAKIETYGLGFLEVAGLQCTDQSGGSLPFFLTTGTTCYIHHNSFVGSKSLDACDQDVLIFGGENVGALSTTNDPTGAFQGYNSEVHGNYFNAIRRAFLGKAYLSSVYVHGNFVGPRCGANATQMAPFEISSAADSTGQTQFIANRIEMNGGYAYAFKFEGSNYNTMIGNDVEDWHHVNNIAIAYFNASSQGNLLINTLRTSSFPAVVDLTGAGDSFRANTVIDSSPNDSSITNFAFGTQYLKNPISRVYPFTSEGPIPATAGVASAAPGFTLMGKYWNGAASANDEWRIYGGIASGTDGTTILYVRHASGSLGTAVVDFNTQVKFGSGASIGADGSATLPGGVGTLNVLSTRGLTVNRVDLAYSASMTPNAGAAAYFTVGANDATAFKIENPINGADNQRITIGIYNLSAGALGAITWGSNFKLAAVTAPSAGKYISIDFFNTGGAWRECARTPVEVTY